MHVSFPASEIVWCEPLIIPRRFVSVLTNTPGKATGGVTRVGVDDLGGSPDELGSSFDCAASRYAARDPSTSVTSLPQSDSPVEIITYIIGNETCGYSDWRRGDMAYLSAIRLARSKQITGIVDVESGGILQVANVARISTAPAWIVRDRNGSLC